MYRSGRCFALSRTAPQAPSCRARVMRHQAAVTGDKGRGKIPAIKSARRGAGRPAVASPHRRDACSAPPLPGDGGDGGAHGRERRRVRAAGRRDRLFANTSRTARGVHPRAACSIWRARMRKKNWLHRCGRMRKTPCWSVPCSPRSRALAWTTQVIVSAVLVALIVIVPVQQQPFIYFQF